MQRAEKMGEGKKAADLFRPVYLILFAACLLLGFLTASQYLSLRKSPEEKFVADKSIDELSSAYIALYQKNADLRARYETLSENVSDLQDSRNDEQKLAAVLQNERDTALRQAGLAAVTGGGITVTVNPDDSIPISANMLIQFINEIKAADASAISINDQRVVPMTEIRDTVNGYSVNGVYYSYDDSIRIQAIGSGVDMYGALQMVGGILDKWEQSHIDVHVDIVDNLTVPALGDQQRERMDLSLFAVSDDS